MRYVPSFLILLFMLALFVLLTGCNTLNGFGKDLQSWTADETHGHHMAEEYRRQQLRQERY